MRQPVPPLPGAVTPSLSLLQGAAYTPAALTDIRARFARMKAEAAAPQPANVQQLCPTRKAKR